MRLSIQSFFASNLSFAARMKFIRDNYPLLYHDTQGKNQINAIYDSINGITHSPLCVACCENRVKFNTFTAGYHKYCCHKCSVSNTETALKREKTNMEKYGGRSAFASEEIRAKKKNTMLQRYGVEHILQNDTFKRRVVAKNKGKTDLEKQDINARKTSTLISRYGTSHLWEVPYISEKRKHTCMAKFGVEYALQSPNVKEKSKSSRNAKFVASFPTKFLNVEPLFTAEDFDGVENRYPWRCLTCDSIFDDHIDDGSKPVCPTCFPKFGSVGETEVIAFVKSLGFDVTIHDRKTLFPKELDILIPSKNIAIEYCGLYWHSEKKVRSNYHLEKFQECESKGIHLITIFEDEWMSNKETCKSTLAYLLGVVNNQLKQEAYTIRPISRKEFKDQLTTFHIQGYTPSTIKLGAFHGNDLVAVMGFSKVSSATYELTRYVINAGPREVAHQLMHYFNCNYHPNKIVTISDLRWEDASWYLAMGFTKGNQTPPNFYLSNDGVHRFPANETNSKDTRYYRIYDCGNIEYVKEIPAIPVAAIQP